MNKRQLGNSSLSIAPLVLGGNVFGWTADEATSFAILDAFVAGGGVGQKYLTDKGLTILTALDTVSERLHATPAQVALAWIMAQPGLTAPIASATSAEQVEELLKATDLQLDAEALEQLEGASVAA